MSNPGVKSVDTVRMWRLEIDSKVTLEYFPFNDFESNKVMEEMKMCQTW